MRSTPPLLAAGAVLVVAIAPGVSLEAQAAPPLRFEISFPRTVRSAPVDGRVLLMVSTRAVIATMEHMSRLELVLGTRGRSTGQFDIWQAVYSPVGQDGYPKPIFDKRTGVIDPKVAEYWKQNYDLSYILERAVRLLEKFLESTKEPGRGPYYGGSFEYGPGRPQTSASCR